MDYIIWVLYDFLIFGAIGMLIGQRKGRVLAGLIWSMLLGPFGWAAIALGPNLKNAGAKPCPHRSSGRRQPESLSPLRREDAMGRRPASQTDDCGELMICRAGGAG